MKNEKKEYLLVFDHLGLDEGDEFDALLVVEANLVSQQGLVQPQLGTHLVILSL